MLASRIHSLKPVEKEYECSHVSELVKDEEAIILEMLNDCESPYWKECLLLVQKRVYGKAKNIPGDDWDDIVQEVMIKVVKNLPSFRLECTFRSWLYQIVTNSIRDMYRAHKRHDPSGEVECQKTSLVSWDDGDFEIEEHLAIKAASVEDTSIRKEEVRECWEAAREYAFTHRKAARNQEILRMVMIGGYSYIEAAQKTGCHPTVAGYVVREAQDYVRRKMEYSV